MRREHAGTFTGVFTSGKDIAMIYVDNAATTKMSGAAINAMTTCMQDTWGNPSSLYSLGQRAKRFRYRIQFYGNRAYQGKAPFQSASTHQ